MTDETDEMASVLLSRPGIIEKRRIKWKQAKNCSHNFSSHNFKYLKEWIMYSLIQIYSHKEQNDRQDTDNVFFFLSCETEIDQFPKRPKRHKNEFLLYFLNANIYHLPEKKSNAAIRKRDQSRLHPIVRKNKRSWVSSVRAQNSNSCDLTTTNMHNNEGKLTFQT